MMFAKLKNKLNLIFSKIWTFLRPKQKLGLVSFVFLSSFFIVAWLVFTPFAHAGVGDWVVSTFSSILFAIAGLLIKLTFFVLKFIIEVAGYNGFIDSPAVIVGWVMVRDITNMFFVVVLLIISFGTILGLEQYEYKKLLVKLIMAAIIVNFSRVICGLIIDIAQVVMITFVNGIAATASGNLVSMFKVDQIFKLSGDTNSQTQLGSPSTVFLAAVAAIAFATIMFVTMLTFLFLLMARMAMLWVLIVLSPFAFVLNVLPQTQGYAKEWWGDFGGHVVAGPIIAFFLWLSFVTVGAGNAHDEIIGHNGLQVSQTTVNATNPAEEEVGITSIMSWANMANFAIAIAMLLAGAKMAQRLGVVGGSMMGKAGELGKKVAMYASGIQAGRWAARKGWEGTKKAGKFGMGLATAPFKRVGRNIQSKVAARYYDWQGRRTTAAGKIAKVFAVNEKGQYVKKIKVPKKDAAGNIIPGQFEEKEELQGGLKDWGKRMLARGRLALPLGYGTFKEEYSKDLATVAENKKGQLEHLASTSSLGVGLEKRKSEEWLQFLKDSGQDIKSGRTQRMIERREEIMQSIDGGGDVDGKLSAMGLNSNEIAMAKSGRERLDKALKGKAQAKGTAEYTTAEKGKREVHAMEQYMAGAGGLQETEAAALKAETKQIEDKLNARKQTKETEALKGLLGGKLSQEALKASEIAALAKETLEAETSRRRAETKEALPGRLVAQQKIAEERATGKQIEEQMAAEKSFEELAAIHRLLEGAGKGRNVAITATKAKTESLQEAMDLQRNKSTLLARAKEYRNVNREGGPDLLKANLSEQQAHSLELNKMKEVYKTADIGPNERANIAVQLDQKVKEARAVIENGVSSQTAKDEALESLKSLIKQKDSLHDFSTTQSSYDAVREESEELRAVDWDELYTDENVGRRYLSRRLGKKVEAGKEQEALDEYRGLVGDEEFDVRMRQFGAHMKIQQGQGNHGGFVFKDSPNKAADGTLTGMTDYKIIIGRTGEELAKEKDSWLKNNYIDTKKMLEAAGSRRLGKDPGSGTTLVDIDEKQAAFNAEALGTFTQQSIASMGKRGFIGDLNGSDLGNGSVGKGKVALAEQLSAFAAKASNKQAFDALTNNLKNLLEKLKVDQKELDDLYYSVRPEHLSAAASSSGSPNGKKPRGGGPAGGGSPATPPASPSPAGGGTPPSNPPVSPGPTGGGSSSSVVATPAARSAAGSGNADNIRFELDKRIKARESIKAELRQLADVYDPLKENLVSGELAGEPAGSPKVAAAWAEVKRIEEQVKQLAAESRKNENEIKKLSTT